jgi:hypothetical protein
MHRKRQYRCGGFAAAGFARIYMEIPAEAYFRKTCDTVIVAAATVFAYIYMENAGRES